MLSQIQNVLAIAILGVLIVPSGVLQQPPSTSQPPENGEKRSHTEHKTTDNGEHPSRQTPFVLDFLSSDGLQKISAYCANKPDEDPDEWLHEKFVCDVHITDVAIAIFTGLLVLVTIPLTLVGLCQSRIASNTAKRQLRAYMGGAALPDKNIYAPQFLAQMVVTNSGQTPAYDVCVGSKMSAYDNPLPDGFIFEAVPYRLGGPRYVVNPNSKHSILVEANPTLTPEDKVAIKEGRKCLYLWGEIRYRDAFSKHRFTTYKKTRFRLVWLHKRGLGMWNYCDDGNDAT